MKFEELLVAIGATHVEERYITQTALLLEYFSSGTGEGVSSLMDQELLGDHLDKFRIKALIDSLFNVASQSDYKLQASAIWAIGKSGCSDVVSRIVSVANSSESDEVVYQSLIAIEDCDINQAWNFIEHIAKSEFVKASEFAKRKLELKSLGVYDQ